MTSKQPTILYVEDEPRSRRVMQLITTEMDVSALTMFEDSSDFLERVNRLDPQPDLVFLDIHVRPHSGFEMLGMLRQIDAYAKTPVVAMTASVMNEEIQELRTAGFNGCLAKPIDMDTFPDAVVRILNGESIWHIVG